MQTSDHNELLKRLYYDPKVGLGGVDKLYRAAKNASSSITKKEVKDFISKQSTSQIFKERRVKHHYPLSSDLPFKRVQIDLLDIESYNPNRNGGNRFIFILIDVFSRVVLAIPQKRKTDSDCLNSFKTLIRDLELDEYHVRVVDSDNEAGFKSHVFKQYCKEKEITQHFNDPSDHRALSVVDRFCRTLRNLITRYQQSYQTQSFIPILQDLIDNYNNSVNRSLGQSPMESLIFSGSTSYQSMQRVKADTELHNKARFKIGDRVRVLKRKTLFQKGSSSFSKTVHTIERIENGRYYVDDREKGYRKSELQEVNEIEDIPPMEEDHEERKEENRIEKRITRSITKEGIDRERDIVADIDAKVLRRYRKERDHGFMILS
jgi:hypothetical protein